MSGRKPYDQPRGLQSDATAAFDITLPHAGAPVCKISGRSGGLATGATRCSADCDLAGGDFASSLVVASAAAPPAAATANNIVIALPPEAAVCGCMMAIIPTANTLESETSDPDATLTRHRMFRVVVALI